MENNLLQACFNVRLIDRLPLVDMHLEASLVSLEQRRQIPTLGLMYIRALPMLNLYLLEMDIIFVLKVIRVVSIKVVPILRVQDYGMNWQLML